MSRLLAGAFLVGATPLMAGPIRLPSLYIPILPSPEAFWSPLMSATIPEPASVLLLGSALAGFAYLARKRRSR